MSRRLTISNAKPFPAYVVWELTLRCDQRCTHCGSRALMARPHELNKAQALRVIEDLIALKAREVILIGGEAYLHEDFFDIVSALTKGGISVSLTTGGRGIDDKLAEAMKSVGIKRVSVSIDGIGAVHDRIRANKGSFDHAFLAFDALKKVGIKIGANTTINRLNMAHLEELYELLKGKGISAWQVQILAPLGRAADRPAMLLQPYDLLDILPRIVKLKERAFNDGILLMPGNNLGYFGPEEAMLRSPFIGGTDYFAGCQAGRFILGIESNGTIKGCPSLQSHFYAAGSIAEKSLVDLWDNAAAIEALRTNSQKELWGFCASCPYGKTCQAGCTFTAHALFGKAGNNPYCHYRARTLASQGYCERLRRIRPATGQPFDHGLFEIIQEAADAHEEKITPHQMLRIQHS